MCGCNGKMGRVISQMVKEDDAAEIVAGIDISGEQLDSYPVYKNITECTVQADAVIDFSSPKALKDILKAGLERKLVNLKLYKKYIGSQVKLKLFKKIAETKELQGNLVSVKDNIIVLNVSGTDTEIDIKEIAAGNTVFDFDNM